jgi:GntR family transcriptional regulator/MocR family aminotransferase
MEETWANGLDLHLDVSGTRPRAQLEGALRDAVRDGRLRAGTRLPSSRTLAADLGIARNTVAEVYAQLVAEGWLTAHTGSGTSVAEAQGTLPHGPRPATPAHDPRRPRYDLRAGEPDLSAFPRGPWLAAARKALAAAPDAALGYGDRRGLAVLRTVLAGYLARARGVAADPAHVVLCSGFAHGLAVLSRALRATGVSELVMEEYGHHSHRVIASSNGLAVRSLRVDDDGAVPDTSAEAVMLTPAHQFPLGMTLHPVRRREFAQHGGVVIEDDYDGEFRYDRQPAGAMQALAPDNVIYCGTASKSLAPGVRLAWLVVPPRLLDPVLAALDGGPSALDQLTLAEFIASGAYDRQIRRARLAYRSRRDRLVAAVSPLGLRVGGIAAGHHGVITTSESPVLERAAAHGIALEGLSQFAHDATATQAGLVIGYARPPEHAYTTALARLCALLADGRRD